MITAVGYTECDGTHTHTHTRLDDNIVLSSRHSRRKQQRDAGGGGIGDWG